MTVAYLDQSSDESSAKWVLALLAALVLHGIVLPTGAYLWPPSEPSPAAEPRFQGMRVMAVREEPQDEPEPADRRRQMVSLPQPTNEERPDEANFEDQYDRRVERETVNRDDSLRPQATTNEAAPTGALTMPSQAPAAQTRAPSIPRGTTAPPGAAAPRESATSDGGVMQQEPRVDPRSEMTGEDTAVGEQPGGSTELGVAEGSPNAELDLSRFMPTAQTAGALVNPGARRNDAIMLEEGDRTALNSVRSLYWSFFNRMQDQLSQHWNPNGVYARHDPTFELHGRRDRYTVLSVTLNGDGTLRHAVVERSSGLDFYDDECVRAFRAAAPFLNVPEGLKDENGQARFTFGFMLNMTTRSARVRRLDGF